VKTSPGESEDEALHQPWRGAITLNLQKDIPGYGRNTGFRFVKITFLPTAHYAADVSFSKLAANFIYYPVEYRGSFAASDPLLTKIWYTGAYTTHVCMQDDIWDAIKRDREAWMGDLVISGEVINNVFGDRFLMEQTLSRLRLSVQPENGAPTDFPTDHINHIPGYSYAWIQVLADFHRHQGDYDYLLRQHDLLVSMLQFIMTDYNSQMLFVNTNRSWNFVDWGHDFKADSRASRITTQLFLVKALNEASFLFQEMNDTENAQHYAALAEQLKLVARKHFQNPITRWFGEDRPNNAMAIYAGVANPNEYESIYLSLGEPLFPNHQNYVSPYFRNYLIFAQGLSGHTQETIDFMKTYWGAMLNLGASTWFENFDLSWPKEHFHEHMGIETRYPNTYNVSLSHAWSSGPTNWLTERVLGIRPVKGGFSETDLDPDLGALEWVSGTVPTPHGALQVRVEQTLLKRTMQVELPVGVTLRIFLANEKSHVNGEKKVVERTADGRRFIVLDHAGNYTVSDFI
jgi:alpha-L-rhamnosidase